jgi:hypothetical protein
MEARVMIKGKSQVERILTFTERKIEFEVMGPGSPIASVFYFGLFWEEMGEPGPITSNSIFRSVNVRILSTWDLPFIMTLASMVQIHTSDLNFSFFIR